MSGTSRLRIDAEDRKDNAYTGDYSPRCRGWNGTIEFHFPKNSVWL